MASTFSGYSVKVTGLREVVRGLERLGVEAEDLREGFGAISAKVAETAKGEAPVRTGALRSNIRGSRRKNAAVISSSAPRGGRPYHRFNYFGTSRQPANRYLARAVAREIGFVEEAVEDALQVAILKVGLGS